MIYMINKDTYTKTVFHVFLHQYSCVIIVGDLKTR
jgi:hypothetical protein